MMDSDLVQALETLLRELSDGPAPGAAWILNPGDPGLLSSLDRLPAAEASLIPKGGSSVAAHVDHLRYGMELLNRWSRGDDPFADADYSVSWTRNRVSEGEWAFRRNALRIQLSEWREALTRPRHISSVELTGVLASIAHLAYHMGAIRQINLSLRGPAARD
jgi:hypothetical protein